MTLANDEDIDDEFEADEEFDGDGEDDEAFDDEGDLDGEGDTLDDEDGALVDDEDDDPDDADAAVPAHRARAATEEDEEENFDDADDVEADLDTILKDKMASGDDDEEDEEEEPAEHSEAGAIEGVIVKREGEFTCQRCFMIVHPRQFGRKGRLTCPIGDEDCPSIAVVEAQIG
ncbi:MAG: hypothetical protein R2698_11480 [Microthrixaceae bacterium]